MAGLIHEREKEVSVIACRNPVELRAIAFHEAARKPEMRILLAIERTGPCAIHTHSETAARSAHSGEIDCALRAMEGLGDEEIDHRAGEIPRVAGIHRGEVPLPRRCLHGVRALRDERDEGAVVAGIIGEPPDHAVARDISEEIIVRERRGPQQRAVRVHPEFHRIRRRGHAHPRDAPRGHGLLRRGDWLGHLEAPDVIVPAK